MSYNITYVDNIQPLVTSVFIDARATTMPSGINGNEVQILIDQQLAQINDQTIVYKIETDFGNLVGYFTLQVNTSNKTCMVASEVIRQAFQQYSVQISEFINNFIQSNDWQFDYLF